LADFEPGTVLKKSEIHLHRSAVFSADQTSRFDLVIPGRVVPRIGLVQFVGLNPSTATEDVDDPTVRRCRSFADREFALGMVMTNAFGFRSTDPKGVAAWIASGSPGELDNWRAILGWAHSDKVSLVVLCWGDWFAKYASKRVRDSVEEMTEHRQVRPKIRWFRRNVSGEPVHPLYLSGKSEMKGFEHE
jgi:hypothetical protein